MDVTERVARFVTATRFDEIPEAAIAVAKGAMMDCLGVTLAAVREPASEIITDFVRELGGNPVSTVLGAGFKTSPPHAALANGTMAHALDYDDVVVTMAGHPSVPVLPAVLALGDYKGASGRDVVAAYVMGYEVETKLGQAVAGSFYTQGWHPTAVLGTMGAAAASARLLDLSVAECAIALGIAASQASGLRQNFGTYTKPFHAGHAARSGVVAAMLAGKGFIADAGIIDGSQGFLNTFGERGQAKLGPLIEGLGKPYDMISTMPSMKQYPCCASTHRPLDAILHIVSNWDIDPQAVASIVCTVSERVKVSLIHSNPTTGLEGKFCLEYVVAAAIVDKRIGLRTFDNDRVLRPAIRAVMDKFQWDIRGGDVPYTGPTTVTVKLTDGREFSHSVINPKGSPEVPMSSAELEAKYRDCASRALSGEDVERSLDMLAKLEELADIRLLTDLVGKRA